MTSVETPFTNELKRRLAEYNNSNGTRSINNHHDDSSSSSFLNSGNVGGVGISPRGVFSHHHQPRAGSIEADQCGWIEGVAVTDGSSDLDHNARGVKVGQGSAIAPLKRVGGGGFSLSYSGPNKDKFGSRSSSQTDNQQAFSYTQPTFNDRSFGSSNKDANNNNNYFMTSGMNSTPRESYYQNAPTNNNNNINNTKTLNLNNNNNRVTSPVGTKAWNRGPPQPGEVDPEAPEYTGDYENGDDDDDGENYDDGEFEEGEEFEEDADFEDQDVLPAAIRSKCGGPLPANGRRGLDHGDDNSNNDTELEQKAEFESFAVVRSLLAQNGAGERRDILDYHTSFHFLQFLEQLMCGAYFIRYYNKHGTPHERYVYLRMLEVEGEERPFFCQSKHATAVQIDDLMPVSDLVGVICNASANAFRRQRDKKRPGPFIRGCFVGSKQPLFSTEGCMSLYFWNRKGKKPRSLDLLTTNMAVFRLWKVTCEALVAVNSSKSNGRFNANILAGYLEAAKRAVEQQNKATL
jgi:hypothetical protein